MSDPVGTIISTEDTPSPDAFEFVLREPVKKEQFVAFETEEGRAIAQVANVRKTNQYFANAGSVSEYEKDGTPLGEMLPTDDWEYRIGTGRILGVYDDRGLVQRPSFPPSPGTDVELAETDRLKDFLGLEGDSGITIGDVKFQDLPASLNLTKLFQKHLAILAQSGAGKSYLSSVLIEELLDRDATDGQLAVVAIDPHGEYAGFAKDKTYMDRVTVYGEQDIQISAAEMSAGKLSQYFHDVTAPQQRELNKIFSDLKGGDDGVFTLDTLIAEVEQRDMPKKTRQVWLDRLNTMKAMGVFGRYDNPSQDTIEPGKLTVLDLSDIVWNQKKQVITAYFTDLLFKARRKGDVPPFFLLVEEAHNFVPSNTASSDHPARSVIRKIAREGRKFHACLGLISQRPAHLDQTALSQCNTNFILRVTNPSDLDRIKQGAEGITGDLMDTIPGLRVGEAYVIGEAVNSPTPIDVRRRRSEEFETGRKLEDVAKDWTAEKEQAESDVKAFM